MNTARLDHTATVLPNSKVLVAGGYQQTNVAGSPFSSAETYDPSTNIWSLATSLTYACEYFTATLLNTGHVREIHPYRLIGAPKLRAPEFWTLVRKTHGLAGQH
jgi:hypothetical protein